MQKFFFLLFTSKDICSVASLCETREREKDEEETRKKIRLRIKFRSCNGPEFGLQYPFDHSTTKVSYNFCKRKNTHAKENKGRKSKVRQSN